MDHEPELKAQMISESATNVDNEPGKTHIKTTEVQGDSNFHETVTVAPLDPWSRTSLQLYAILLVASLNATASGFDGVSRTREVYEHMDIAAESYGNSPSSALSMP